MVAPQIEGVWLGFGELAMLLAGGWTLFAVFAELPEGSILTFAAGERGIQIARILFAIWVIPVGLSHIFYVQQTADYVPAWLPFRAFWAYVTGIGHMASGIGVLFSIFPRVAALAEAGMLSVITLLVWLPAVLAAPKTRLPWTAFFISWAITAAVWVVAASVGKKSSSM